MKSAYTVTDTALVECVEGNPYSRAAECDIVIRFKGGESGRGRHHMSFKKPLKKTPDASTCTILDHLSAHLPSQGFLHNPYPLPRFVYPHQKRMGRTTVKKVCVPRFAVTEKYVSSAGDRTAFWIAASRGVSQRTRGMSR